MKKLEWDRLVPLGISGRKVRNWLLTAWGAGIVWSMQFVENYLSAYKRLYTYGSNGNIVWLSGVQMKPFGELVYGSFALLDVFAMAMVPLAVGLYLYHTVNARSIYTMKRLKHPWELWRRVLAMPVWGSVLFLLTRLLLGGIFALIYCRVTPAACLP